MFHSRVNRNEKTKFFAFPTTKLKNISCAFCRHEFVIRDFSNLRGPALPLLLSCGHAACHQCVKIHSDALCPLCPGGPLATETSGDLLRPVNVYVTGLLGVNSGRPLTDKEPDISFSQSLSSKVKERSDNDLCLNCDAIATVRCLQCNTVYCHMCAEKMHSKLEPTEKHFRVLLTDTNKNSMIVVKTCREHVDFEEYYCRECDSSHCSRCMLHNHQQHRVIPQAEKNEEYMEEFGKVRDDLVETLQRVRQTQKRLRKNLISPEESESSEMVETAVNQHFAHLHGVLQNIERRMIDKLYKQRNYLSANLRDIETRLKKQEDQLQSALMMAATVNEVIGKINLRDVVSELERLADVPCHLIRDPIVNDEKIIFCPDPNIIKTLENHCKVEIPKVSGYSLLRNDTLPIDYEVEPLNTRELPKLLDESLSLNATLQRAPSCQSVCTRRTEPQAFREGHTCLVYVCYIENPSNFYIRQVCYNEQIKEVEHQLATYRHNFNEPSEVQINKIYAVKHATKKKWYRGRVSAINTIDGVPDSYQVFDVDWGSTETQVSISRMRHLSETLSAIPQMTKNCALYDIVPFDGKWHSPARKFMMDVVRKNPPCAVTLYIVNVKGNTYYVDICEDQVSVRDSLIYLGHGAFVTTQYLRRTCPQAVRKFLREDMGLESYFEVLCSHVESPDCIYVQKVGDHHHFLCNLTTEMSKHYNQIKSKSNAGMIFMPEVGIPCAVEETEGQWFRGTIHAVLRPRMVEVFLVDFGSKISIKYNKIRRLNEKFMVSPVQAIKVKLTDIEPRAGEWCKEAIEFTKRGLEQKYARVFAFEERESGYDVALYITDKESHENFAALLAGSGLAVSTGPRSSGYARVTENRFKSKNRKPKLRNSRTNGKKKFKSKEHRLSRQFVTDASTNDPYRLLVKIVRVVSPDTIYICDLSLTREYEQMMTEMQKFYNKYKDKSSHCDWRVNSPCVVYSSRDRCFCRGEIIGFESTDKAKVFLYDLAVTETLPIVELQSLEKKFAMTATYVCKVKLAGILPCGGSTVWPSTSCEKLIDIVSANQNSKFYISKVVTPDDEALNVDLWLEEVKIDSPLAPARIEINSINRALVDAGLALPIKQYNEKKKTVLALELKREISFVDEASMNESINWTSNGNFKERRSNVSIASNKVDCNRSIVSSASSVASNNDDEVGDAISYLDSSTSNDDLPGANDTADTLTINEPEVDTWLPAEPIPDDNFVAVGTNVDYSSCVYLYPKKKANMLHYIEETLDAEYSTMKIEPEDLVWKTGEPCVAQYHCNKKWYRAVVLRTLDNNMIEVVFVDYGNIEECENGTLRKRLAMTDIPRQCTKCKIAGLVPDTPNGKWRIGELDTIHSQIVEKECEVSVLERKSDHLVISIVLLSPTRRQLLPYLINDLHLTIRTEIIDAACANNKSESTIDNSGDVIIDGYVKDPVSKEKVGGYNDEGKSKSVIDLRERKNEEDKDSAKNGFEEKGTEEMKDIFTMTTHPQEVFANADNDPSANDIGNETFTIDDFSTNENIADSVYPMDDAIISGTANFTLNVDQIEISQREARKKLERNISHNNSIREDEIVASTPFDDSLVSIPKGYKMLIISKEVSGPVKAEIVLVGLSQVWLHLSYNEKSESISKIRDRYEKVIRDMQDYANEQPILKYFKKNTPCCAKFVDDKWYRCKVLKSISEPRATDQMVKVQYVDWGNEDIVRCDKVRTLKDEWLEPPCMAFCCKLWGVIENPSVATDDISRMKVQKAWKVDEKPQPPVYVKIQGRTGKIHDVQIYSDKECTKLVYQSLLDDGLLLNENGNGDD